MRILPAVLTFCAICPAAEAAENPWAAMAKDDLQAIHDTIEANHPGPVDPENSRFAKWFAEGLMKANARARTATSYSDYVRTLRFYANGFQDGHIGIGLEVVPTEQRWPGFIVGKRSVGSVEVIYADTDAGVKPGARLLSCDGQSVAVLLAQRTDPYFWNAGIPHERMSQAYHLFYQDALDPLAKLNVCTFSTGKVTLKWHRVPTDELEKMLDDARGGGSRTPKIQFLNGVWLISIPTFAFPTDERVRQATVFAGELERRAPELRNATIVFDVRGNHGGDSA